MLLSAHQHKTMLYTEVYRGPPKMDPYGSARREQYLSDGASNLGVQAPPTYPLKKKKRGTVPRGEVLLEERPRGVHGRPLPWLPRGGFWEGVKRSVMAPETAPHLGQGRR